MPLDTFICGRCQLTFNEIDEFVLHKREGCEIIDEAKILSEVSDAVDSVIPVNIVNEVEGAADLGESQNQTVIIIQPGTDQDGNLDFSQSLLDSNILDMVQASTLSAAIAKPPAKKPGRKPKQKSNQEKTKKDIEKPTVPEIGADGRLHCKCCKRSFTKERHFNTHKCLAVSDYVDITKKEAMGDDADEDFDEDNELDEAIDDDEDEYRAEDDDEFKISSIRINPPMIDKDAVTDKFPITGNPSVTESRDAFENVQVSTDPDVENTSAERLTSGVDDIPVFGSEEEKLEFEKCLNIDLSGVDHMYKQHIIQQDLNENAPSASRQISNSLSLYSCNTCEKIFKTLSHMRLHCFTHTNIKPFRCPRCDYNSNSKGNLYTHMRKHTGQYYRCRFCGFKSVNKSHLIEHEETHDKARHQCEICKKDYNTVKSLINHVRKYHFSTKRGKDYLHTFLQGRQVKGSTVIHQCHVCNRKFKKKVDRDRHLFVHDIKDIPNIQHCVLCDYTASRRVYLDKHFLKHRVIYRCVECNEKFLSTIRLIDHLTSTHLASDPSNKWEDLFEQCINYSLYLPEPDESLPEEEKVYLNLPPELSSSVMKGEEMLQQNVDKVNLSSTNPPQEDAVSLISLPTGEVTQVKPLWNKEGTGTIDLQCNGNNEQTAQQNDVNSDVLVDKEANLEIAGDAQSETINQDQRLTAMSAHNSDLPVQNSDIAVQNSTLHVQNSGESVQPLDEAIQTSSLNSTSNNSIILQPEEASQETSDNHSEKANKDDICESAKTDGLPVSSAEIVNMTTDNEENIGEDENEEESALDTEMEGDDEKEGDTTGISGEEIITRLGYHQMSMEIFQKMRETFGHEECEYCGKLYYNKTDFDNHIRTHTGDKPFFCDLCGYRAITKDSLNRHREKEHDRITYTCTECDFMATSRAQLWNHTMKHRADLGIDCPQCQQKFENIKKLRLHYDTDHEGINLDEHLKIAGYLKHRIQGKLGRRSYKCPYCDRIFIRASSELQKHIWIHEGIKPFKCPLCPHACRSKNNLQAHMLRHSNSKPFSCPECGKSYKSKTALRWHVRSHKDGKLFKCEKCPYEATQSSHLKRHMETHDVIKRFVCQHCDYSANTLGYMKIHYTRNHKGKQYIHTVDNERSKEQNDSQASGYRCLSCDYLFGNLSDLKRHLKVRHHLQIQQLDSLDQIPGDVQVVQYNDDQLVVDDVGDNVETFTTVQPLQNAVVPSELDEKTASAVNIIQQIIDMSQQGTFGQQQFTVQGEDGQTQQITVQAQDGQLVTVNPETIIVQQDGEEVLVTDSHTNLDSNQQYVIQYVTPQEAQIDPDSLVEMTVQTDNDGGQIIVPEPMEH